RALSPPVPISRSPKAAGFPCAVRSGLEESPVVPRPRRRRAGRGGLRAVPAPTAGRGGARARLSRAGGLGAAGDAHASAAGRREDVRAREGSAEAGRYARGPGLGGRFAPAFGADRGRPE